MIFDKKMFESICEEFSGSLAKREVEQIAQFHRIQASPGFHDAALHVLARLKEIGVKSKMERFPSDGRRKYFTWTSPVGWSATQARLELIEPEKKTLAKYPQVPCSLAAHSKMVDGEFEVVDVETGLEPREYEGRDVKGKVVLASRRSAEVFRPAMLERGAAGILSYLPDRPQQPDMIPYNALWPKKSELKKLGFSFSLSRRAALEIKSYIAAGRKVKVKAKVAADIFPSKLDVLTAQFPGKGPGVLFIAHLCHPQPGANDNASGAGTLIELVRTIKALTGAGKLRLRRPVRFMWVPEMFGTLAYLDSHPELAANTLCCINLDMVGENQALCNSKLLIYDTPWSVPSFLCDLVCEGLEAAAEKVRPDPSGSRAMTHFQQMPYSGGSDHYILAEATCGVPAVMVNQWPDTFYHTHADSPEYVDATQLARVGVASLAAGLFAANAGAPGAIALSAAVEAHANTRFSQVMTHRFEHLRSTGKDKLPGEYHRVRRHLMYALAKEGAAIHSIRQLSKSREVQYYLENAEDALDSREAAGAAKLDRYIRGRLSIKGAMPPQPADENLEHLARVVPSRLFAGPLEMGLLRESPESDKYYREKMKKDSTNGQRLYETINLMDGRRRLSDIYQMVDAEFPFFEIELLEQFVEDLRQLGLVQTRKVRRSGK